MKENKQKNFFSPRWSEETQKNFFQKRAKENKENFALYEKFSQGMKSALKFQKAQI